jgi:predicted AlkP superfamily phosphohydrolase/phosphomutase
MSDNKKKKLYLVGIDSAPLWIIEKLGSKHNMKGFKLLAKEGILTSMESTIPPVTSAAWPTIYTGLEPKDHGVTDFSIIGRDYSKELLYYDANRNPPFWDVLAEKGLSSLVMTPAVALQKSKYDNVDMLTGWPLQPRFSSSRVEEAAKKFGYDGEADIGNALNTGKMTLEEASKLYTEGTKKRADLSKYLIEKNNYDLAFVCFTETDRIQHYSLNLKDWAKVTAPLYEEISDFIVYLNARIEKLHENAAIMLVSDHGAQPIDHKFLSNSWMVHNNYAVLKDEVYKRDASKSKGAASNVKRKIVDRLVESRLRREIYTRLPKTLKKAGEKFVEDSYDYESQGKYIRITESDFNMQKTKAFCSVSTGTVGMILINDSRFAHPTVSSSEKKALKAKIIGSLKTIKDLSGGKLMKNVYDGTKYFPANGKKISPDIIFELENGYTADYSGYSEGLYVEPEINRRGEHTKQGIFGLKFYNDTVNLKKIKNKDLKLSSVSPTILKYFGVATKNGTPLI